ncbi:unnamed protein product, partial [Ectocarpus sp. 12 AP-2014]
AGPSGSHLGLRTERLPPMMLCLSVIHMHTLPRKEAIVCSTIIYTVDRGSQYRNISPGPRLRVVRTSNIRMFHNLHTISTTNVHTCVACVHVSTRNIPTSRSNHLVPLSLRTQPVR